MNKKKRIGYYLIVLILGSVVGSWMGDMLGTMMSAGMIKTFLLKSTNFGFGPAPLDLRVLSLTFGFSLRINFMGVLGILVVGYVLKWMEQN